MKTKSLLPALLIPFLFSCSSNNKELELLKEQNELLTKQVATKKIDSSKNQALYKKNIEYRNNWFKYIEVKNYAKIDKSLGGIYNPVIRVGNGTDYLIDEITVSCSYIKDNGELFKNEQIVVTNIPPKGEKSIKIPDSNRGTSLTSDIVSIVSKKMHFCYSAGNWAKNSEDPYFCK